MSGLHEVDCSGCGRRHVTNGEQARKQRVLRCDCGYFVRLDRALSERRSEPTPPPVEIARVGAGHLDEREEEDDATRMMSTLSAAALSGGGRGRAPQASLVDDERASGSAQREGGLRARPSSPAPARRPQPSIAPSDKPLWYVDLGGTELVQMTIEQLILARRGGKLGEGALVWREGMPTWRPVGTLIPAASASSHPAPLASPSAAPGPSRPPAASAPLLSASQTPFPSRTPTGKRPPPPNPARDEATPRSLVSYERPLATLEFALEKPERTPLLPATRSPLPSIDASAGLSRPPTPLPRASLSSILSTPFPRPPHLPSAASMAMPPQASWPRRSPPPPPRASVAPPSSPLPEAIRTASPLPAAPAARSSERPVHHALLNLQIADTLSERPRWVSACIALVVCVTASAAGASLVRSLKQHPKAQVLPTSATPAPVANAAAQTPATEPPRPAPSSAPLVVDVESLSVEHKRTLPRSVRVTPKPPPAESAESGEEAGTPANDPAPSAPEAAPETSASSDLPAPTNPHPYGTGSLIDQIKKATADEEAGR